MHGSLSFDDGNVICFGDTWEDSPVKAGTYSTIHLVAENEEYVCEKFERLSDGGEMTMPVEKTFWNSVFGSLVDKYGISWSVEYEIV